MFDIFIMDMGGHNGNLQYLTERYPHAKVLRWTTHINCMRKAAKQSRTRAFWLIGTCCEYENFDFHWQPVPWEEYQIHCWASQTQKLGDTFLVPTQSFLDQNPERIDLYQDVNWHSAGVLRLPAEQITYNNDIVQASKTHINTPYAVFSKDSVHNYQEPQLWSNPCIINLNKSKSATIIPRIATGYIDQQMYDYPYLDQVIELEDQPMDVVFISNGEQSAEENFRHLEKLLRKKPNKLHRVTNVKGRVAAFNKIANIVTTDWVFVVTAKLKIDENFDFMWQPDYWQGPKHYIFNCLNTDTGLEYGHMAMVCYNRRLLLVNDGQGLDYTLNQPHEVVPIRSGTANLGSDDQVIWRTTFREVLKLKHYLDQRADIETEYRLKKWLTVGNPQSIQASKDAVEYYDSVNGNYDDLKLSYEWAWCDQYYSKKYLSVT